MAIYSPLRSRRLAAQQAEATQRLIIFQLRQSTFALPLDKVHKATTFDRLYGDANGAGVTLTTYQGRELTVIDVGNKIFGATPTVLPPLKSIIANQSNDSDLEVSHLLILQREDGQLVGLPIDSPPSIRPVAASAFSPLTTTDPQYGNLLCVSARWGEVAETAAPGLSQTTTIFLLDATLVLAN
jgi:chemotaxis signal transduction protein